MATACNRKGFLKDSLILAALVNFAFAQPLYDLLSRHLTFLVAHSAQPIDVFVLVLAFSVALPGLLILATGAVRVLRFRIYSGIQAGLVFVCMFAFLVPVLKHWINAGDGWAALILAGVATLVYHQKRAVKQYLLFLSPAIIIFPIFFVISPSVRHFWMPQGRAGALESRVDSPHPVVWVVYDELPVSSLMDEKDQIDPTRYPNFARMADDSHWFRNAVSAQTSTSHAMTSMLTGTYDVIKENVPFAPVYGEYPVNLFSLLGNQLHMNVLEGHSLLCPDSLCVQYRNIPKFGARLRNLLLDSGVVCAHVVLPKFLSAKLPGIDSRWDHYFAGRGWSDKNGLGWKEFNEAIKDERPGSDELYFESYFRKFMQKVTDSPENTLHFLKSVYPHVPWQYFPSGRLYTVEKTSWRHEDVVKGLYWSADEYATRRMYTRHLLQLGYTDKRFGQLMDLLKKNNLYDKALIVVTADHGISFVPGKEMRRLTPENAHDQVSVPLFIKEPYQKIGEIRDDLVSTADILPTILDVLDAKTGFRLEGVSLFGDKSLNRTGIRVYPYKADPFEYNTGHVASRNKTVREKFEHFGPGSDPLSLYRNGPFSEWVGRIIPPSQLSEGGRHYVIDKDYLGDEFDMDKKWIPALLDGRISEDESQGLPIDLAVTVDGVVASTTRTYLSDEKKPEFQVLLPEDMLKGGLNQIEVYEIKGGIGGLVHFEKLLRESDFRYTLVQDPETLEASHLMRSDGQKIPVSFDEITGTVRELIRDESRVVMVGWLLDLKTMNQVDSLLIFSENKCIFKAKTYMDRSDVRKAYENKIPNRTGFQFVLQRDRYESGNLSTIRFIALSKRGVATEMRLSHF